MQGRRPEDGSITIGQVVGPFGIKGGLRVKVLTDFVERFSKGRKVYLNGVEHKILSASPHKEQMRVVLEGISDANTAEELKWAFLTVPADDLPDLDEGEFLTKDLIGMTVMTTDGQDIGEVSEIINSPAHDIFVVGSVMIPAVHEFVKDIDLESGVITVELIEGMIEE